MSSTKIMINGQIAKSADAGFNLSDPDIPYGYGCYEVLKVRDSLLYFPEFHADRFLQSAHILAIQHSLSAAFVVSALRHFVEVNGSRDCNIKMMLIGHDARIADWYLFSVPAIKPPAGAEKEGVPCLIYHGERHFPQAKSLSMLLSTVAYRNACAAGCYDALLVNRRGEITEGTRTNIFFTYVNNPRIICTPPTEDVLSGITRKTFLVALDEAGWLHEEEPLVLADVLSGKCSLLVSSTSTRLVPVNRLKITDGPKLGTDRAQREVISELDLSVSAGLLDAAAVYDRWLSAYSSP
jgi:branched-chain amino acid aminotransferase